jgi:acetylornithine deacetylase/succinyl-diaminopimelate desuccinylase-like protein
VLVEPTGLRISTANLGCIWARITVGGTVAHSAMSNRPGTVNAITVMHELQKDIMAWGEAYAQEDIYMGERPNVTIACIRGGDPWRLSRNPYACSLYLDIRTVPGQNAEMVKRQLRRVLRSFAARSGGLEPELFIYLTDPATVISDDLPVVQALGAAQQNVMNSRPASIIRRPAADAVHFNVYGVPCVVFGPGGRTHPRAAGRSMHAVGEHVLIEDVVTAARIYLATALDLANRPGDLRRPGAGR